MTEDFKQVRLNVAHGPNVEFEGRVLRSYSTQNQAGSKSRWTELRLWETRAGNWVAESVGCSTAEREIAIVEATVIECAPKRFAMSEETPALEMEMMAEGTAIQQVMDAFGWTSAAKAFAREAGWDVLRRVE